VVHFILATIAWHVNQLHDWLSIQYCVRICTWLTKHSCQNTHESLSYWRKKNSNLMQQFRYSRNRDICWWSLDQNRVIYILM